eukprot:m.868504 g.868504  ORF g.868504 m.868504 type:complete len:568 (-) comp23563_c0_seq4:558-2261(-)
MAIAIVAVLAMGLGICAQAVDGAKYKTVNFTTYRVTPITYTGITNMDSADAYGDVMFGLSQLLLPQLCAIEPSFLWCQNRKYLSGGSAWMVYRSFVMTSRAAFGEYEACNPCSGQKPAHPPAGGFDVYCPPGVKNGTFVCSSYDHSGPQPTQCESGYQIWVEDCLNGTVYKTLTSLDPKTAEGECCAACSADKGTCAGWNMPAGYNGTTCQLMKEPLVMWSDGQSQSNCKAAQVDHSEYGCWFEDPQYNVTFQEYCDKSVCKCPVIEAFKPVGLEASPMCHHRQKQASGPSPHVAEDGFRTAATGDYWKCSNAVQELCYNGYEPTKQCTECATTGNNWKLLQQSGCTMDFVDHLCHMDMDGCLHKVEKVCQKTIGMNSCGSCLEKHTHELELANCSTSVAEYACQGGNHENKWEEYIGALACHMDQGNWYSTSAAGECKGQEITEDCWWYIAEELRMVNSTCADGNVVQNVQAQRPECWANCPGDDGKNITTACFLDCLFETLLGNESIGLKPMDPADIARPFTDSFTKAVGEGGCPAIHAPHLDTDAFTSERRLSATVADDIVAEA